LNRFVLVSNWVEFFLSIQTYLINKLSTHLVSSNWSVTTNHITWTKLTEYTLCGTQFDIHLKKTHQQSHILAFAYAECAREFTVIRISQRASLKSNWWESVDIFILVAIRFNKPTNTFATYWIGAQEVEIRC